MKELQKYKKIENPEQFQELIKHIFTSNEKYFFRGQANADWEMNSTYNRGENKDRNSPLRMPFIFEERYKVLKSQNVQKTRLEAIAWMQHFGLKTILIDFTSDLLNAIWFAFSEDIELENGFRSLYIFKTQKEAKVKYEIKDFKEKKNIYKCPFEIERGLSQKSYFVIDNIEWEKENDLIKIKISDDLKEYIYEWLNSKQIKGTSIYPDLKGIMIDFEKASPVHFFDKGNICVNKGEFKKAIFWFDKCLKVDPKYFLAYINKGSALLMQKRYDEAIVCCDKAIEINNGSAAAYTNKAIALNNLKGKSNDAIVCCDKAIEINSVSDMAYIQKGIALNNLKKFDQAIVCCDKAIEINSLNDRAYTVKAEVLLNKKKYDEAIDCCDKAIEINNLNNVAYTIKSTALFYKQEYIESLKYIEKSIEIYPENQFTVKLKQMTIEAIEAEKTTQNKD